MPLIDHEDRIQRAAPATGEIPPFEKYPLLMVHPGFTPANVGQPQRDGSGRITHHVGGTSLRYPPVQVHTQQDEDYYAGQGYVPSGKGDPTAWVAAHTSPIDIGGFVPIQYPKWVIDREVQDEAEEARVRAMHAGGVVPPPRAPEAPAPYVADPPAAVETAAVQDSRIDALEAKVGGLHDMMGQMMQMLNAAQSVPKPRGRPPSAKAAKPKHGRRRADDLAAVGADDGAA